jgi:hypothetical protein
MSETPEAPDKPAPAPESATVKPAPGRAEEAAVQPHAVRFVGYPKLLFVWPLILAGFVLWPFAAPPEAAPAAPDSPAAVTTDAQAPNAQAPAPAAAEASSPHSGRLEGIGWAYIWVAVVVIMALAVDIDRNQFMFWLVVVALVWVFGLWLKDVKSITVLGDIVRWFGRLDVQYDRALGLAVSVILLVPFILLMAWARLNDRWRITHNDFEHSSFGRIDESLGRGAKTIRTSFPDVLELLLGMAGTLIVYNASGTRELRRIQHVMFLPFVRRRLTQILETTQVTPSGALDEEDDGEDL